jgi:hypothetical protein
VQLDLENHQDTESLGDHTDEPILYPWSDLVSSILSRPSLLRGDAGRDRLLARVMAVCYCPAHHADTGTVPSFFCSGGMATGPGRIALSGILPGAIASAVLGAAELVWSHGGK